MLTVSSPALRVQKAFGGPGPGPGAVLGSGVGIVGEGILRAVCCVLSLRSPSPSPSASADDIKETPPFPIIVNQVAKQVCLILFIVIVH